jgi:hypothetical protein
MTVCYRSICEIMTYRPSPEEDLMLLLSVLTPSEENTEKVRKLLGSAVDFEKLIGLAADNGVASLVYKNLTGQTDVPNRCRDLLRRYYLQTAKSNIINEKETLRLIGLLKDVHVAAIPLKGAIASDVVFGNAGLYPSSDIDILVKPSDLEEVKKVLAANGYEYREQNERDLLAAHYHIIFSNEKHHVEVHWNPAKRYIKITPDFWWEDVSEFEYEGVKVTMLSPERYILYTIFRLFDHGFRPLKYFLLIAALLNVYRHELDCARLLSLAKELRMRRLVIFTLEFLREIYGDVTPELPGQQKIAGHDFFKDYIVSSLFVRSPRIHLSMILYIFLMDSPADIMRVLIRRIFPDVEEIRLRYGLPEGSPKVGFYYLVNPLLLALRKTTAMSDE